MKPELAGHLLWHVRRARAGAAICRQRHLDAIDAAPVIDVGAFAPIHDLRGIDHHDLDYYAWEAGRIVKLARKARAAGLRTAELQAALDQLEAVAPTLRTYRDGSTHPEDNRTLDDVMGGSAVVRLHPGGRVEYLLDVRHSTHDALEALVVATEAALLTIAAPDDGPLPRFDNSGR